MSYKIIDLPSLGRPFNATDIIEVSADGTGSYKANIGNFTLGGENYIFVNSNGTIQENGAAVKSAYLYAQTLTPNGNPLSSTNRITILLAPGYYGFNEAIDGQFMVDQSFIDFESLTGSRDVYFSSIEVFSLGSGIDVKLSGIDTTMNSFYSHGAFAVTTAAGPFENIQIKNCKGGLYSFSSYSIAFNGTYENCEGANFSFGYGSLFVPPMGIMGIFSDTFTNYGTMRNCRAVSNSFCYTDFSGTGGSYNYGTIENCVASGNQSFVYGRNDAVNGGVIRNCIAQDGSFVSMFAAGGPAPTGYPQNYGTIQDCTVTGGPSGGNYSFCGAVFSNQPPYNGGLIMNCSVNVSGSGVFCADVVTRVGQNIGTIYNCYAAASGTSFCGNLGTNSGRIDNCISGPYSFCADNLAFLTGQIRRCTMVNYAWGVGPTSGGRVVLGIDDTGVVNI
jgi:hypothetical protein